MYPSSMNQNASILGFSRSTIDAGTRFVGR